MILAGLLPSTVRIAFDCFRSDSEFTGRLAIKVSCDWQILSLLKPANARSGSETKDAIDFTAIVSFIAQSLLHLPDIVLMHAR